MAPASRDTRHNNKGDETMRKKILVPLSVFLILTLLPAQVFAVNYYEEWGPYEEWTDEQWLESESWTEEEWEAYDEQYYAEQDLRRKQEWGFTNLDGPNLIVDGAYLDFQDALPYVEDGVLLAPLRPILTAVGAAVSYDAGSQTVRAVRGGVSVSIPVSGEGDLAVTQDALTSYIELPKAPYVDGNGVTFAPVRVLAEALGLLFIDYDEDVSELFDREKLAVEIDSHFTILGRLFENPGHSADKTYKITNDTALTTTLYGDKQHGVARLSEKSALLTNSGDTYMKSDGTVDLGEMGDMLANGFLFGSWYSPDLTEFHMEAIQNDAAQTVYVRAPELFSSFYDEIPAGAWLADDADDADLLSDMLSPDAGVSIGNWVIEEELWWLDPDYADAYYYGGSYYEEIQDSAARLIDAFGDDVFRKSGDAYTLRIAFPDLMDLISMLENADNNLLLSPLSLSTYGMTPGLSELLDIIPFSSEENDETESLLTITGKDGVWSEYTISGTWNVQSPLPFSGSFSMRGVADGLEYTIDINGRYIGKYTMKRKTLAVETTEAIPAAPPKGATILRVDELTPSYIEDIDFYDMDLEDTDLGDALEFEDAEPAIPVPAPAAPTHIYQ
jgi:hypothetical protein